MLKVLQDALLIVGLMVIALTPAVGADPAQAQGSGAQAPALPSSLPSALQLQLQALTAGQVAAPGSARVEVVPGQLDPRLKLAPCDRIEPYLPTGARLWGSSKVGLRCTAGPVRWNVYLPVTVKVWSLALVATRPLAAGTDLGPADLALAEVDIAAAPAATFDRLDGLLGRRLAAPLAPGAALRSDMLRSRQWFAAGESVTVIAQGPGFAVSGAGEALGPGIEGQSVRVRTEGGRVLTGTATGDHRVEIR
jgi:flagella basal body P-ring formation protein FlgA